MRQPHRRPIGLGPMQHGGVPYPHRLRPAGGARGVQDHHHAVRPGRHEVRFDSREFRHEGDLHARCRRRPAGQLEVGLICDHHRGADAYQQRCQFADSQPSSQRRQRPVDECTTKREQRSTTGCWTSRRRHDRLREPPGGQGTGLRRRPGRGVRARSTPHQRSERQSDVLHLGKNALIQGPGDVAVESSS